MRTKRTFALLALAALAALVTLGAFRGAGRVRAQDQQPPPINDRISFGLVGVTRGQTLRLSVASISDAICPCGRVLLNFRDAEGRLLRSRDGSVIHRALELGPGQATSLDFDADDIQWPPGPTRLQLRAVVTVIPPDVGDRIVPSVEVFNNVTGRTTLYIGNPGVVRGFNPQPDPLDGD
jgi:hypothetical protein